jgi:hypothetical protein
MSIEEPQAEPRGRRWIVYLAGAGIVVLVGSTIALLALGGKPTGKGKGRGGERAVEDTPKSIREVLAKETDLNACRAALAQVNGLLSKPDAQRPPVLAPQRRDQILKLFNLDKNELAEIEEGTYTALDGRHLELCLLMRDAARTLDPGKVRGEAGTEPLEQTPLERASAAFAWVVRQVRLDQSLFIAHPPAQFLARRGSGPPLGRALLYLELLRQIGNPGELLGCLVLIPDKEGKRPRLWACGVLVGKGEDVYLFDPELGLPLPGKDGMGVATLGELRKDPRFLERLNADGQALPAFGASTVGLMGSPLGQGPLLAASALSPGRADGRRYGFTEEQVRAAEIYQICSLSAMAPRLEYLQKDLLAPTVRVSLAADPVAEHERLLAAARAAGIKEESVKVGKEGTGLLRGFLPPDEGGSDSPFPFDLRILPGYLPPENTIGTTIQIPSMNLFSMELTPWKDLPPDFRALPWNHLLGQRVRELFAKPFVSSVLDPRMPRDLILRGWFSKAYKELVQERDILKEQQDLRAAATGLDETVAQWRKQATADFADYQRAMTRGNKEAVEEARARIENLWKKNEQALILYLAGSVAEGRRAAVTFLLGQCKHEQAEQIQARLDLLSRAPGAVLPPAEVDKAKKAWNDALDGWRLYGEEYPSGPGAVAARRMLGRAQAMVGDWKAAVATWEDLSGPMTEAEKVASLYLARELKKQKADKP